MCRAFLPSYHYAEHAHWEAKKSISVMIAMKSAKSIIPAVIATAHSAVAANAMTSPREPISESPILEADSEEVKFLAREGKRVGGKREQVPVTIPTLELVRRWCEHIQPEQLTKTRYFGGWCNRKRKEYQATCNQLYTAYVEATEERKKKRAKNTSLIAKGSTRSERQPPSRQCPSCESHAVRFIGRTRKPSWSIVLSSRDERCPDWYAEAAHEEFCAYLEREYGISYEDWDLETRIESTMKRAPSVEVHQLYFPGLYPERDYELESY